MERNRIGPCTEALGGQIPGHTTTTTSGHPHWGLVRFPLRMVRRLFLIGSWYRIIVSHLVFTPRMVTIQIASSFPRFLCLHLLSFFSHNSLSHP
ncbi:hypothetical protein BDQ94DRAFT_144342 [Aspergillus welwitschiae]|uniref:Uncharacterized protein n=1 Tax=Aspergillus welwitschiae TaxID=1341132 RepID=A0A3F3Q1E6_9EURO|nr:hypothetical protein BDQ94DRAFT_144342 [Aspergillus welwitschiae]RDH33029.1 hypothetical protein BDQ94DRAFT_144342 [Aspergillus welwitschiae]